MTNASPNTHHLTDTQLVLLSQASQRADGKIVPPVHLRGGVFQRVMASLVGKGFVQSVPSSAGQSGSERDETCPVISLAGLAVLGITTDAEIDPSEGTDTTPVDAMSDVDELKGTVERPAMVLAASDGRLPDTESVAAHAGSPVMPDAVRSPRAGSKQAQVLELLARPDGVLLHEVVTATGWLPHTARAVLSGLRKRGHRIERVIDGKGGSRYGLTSLSTSAT